MPNGKWKSLEEIPNTVSKLVSMRDQVETPLFERFSGRKTELLQAALAVGGRERAEAEWQQS